MPEPTNAKLFGDLLRAFREEAGLSQTDLAKAAYCSQSLISGLENGTKGTRVETIQAIDGAVGAKGKLVSTWPVTASDQQTIENLASLEAEAVKILSWEPGVLPGLLQTPDYARAIMRSAKPRERSDKIEADLAARLERQNILTKDEPPFTWFALDESALRRPYGGKAAMREQLLKLESLADEPNTVIQIMPFTATRHPGQEGALLIMEFPDKPPVWYTEGRHSGRMTEAKDEVSMAMTHFDLIRAAALSPEQSIEFIASARGIHYE
jgi:transcriptional regulator with XRE-family HTH domain